MPGTLVTGEIRVADRLNILILHRMGDPQHWRESVAELELALPRYAPEHNYLVHNALLPLPSVVKEFGFDAIIMNSTFLSAAWNPKVLRKLRDTYSFLTHSQAFKIALPQDDYYCPEEIDSLMIDWGIDLLYTVCPDHWEVLYPKYLAKGGVLKLGYTGYITPKMRQRALSPKPRETRCFDVVYRASGIPSFPNKMASLKAEIGNTFLREFADQPWTMNISNEPVKTIHGESWWDFIEDSRCVIGANSGSSNLIRNHDVVKKIRQYTSLHPNALDDEILDSCLSVEDRELRFTAISPRVLEASLLETAQILVQGEYSGLLTPWEDYIPLSPDCSNKQEVIRLISDLDLQERIALSCKNKLLATKAIQIETFINDIMVNMPKSSATRIIKKQRQFKQMLDKYNAMITREQYIHNVLYATKNIIKNILPRPLLNMLRALINR